MNPNESTGQQPEGGAIEFLRSKGILGEDKTQWILNFSDGRSFDLVKLMAEYIEITSHPSYGVEQLQKQYTAMADELNALRSLSRWREIAVDGLPGDEDLDTYFIFLRHGEPQTGTWRYFLHRYASFIKSFTHWRPIDLPTP